MPRISVIIPTYNRAGFLAEAIESVLSQDYGDLELIVVDDGSTDNTHEIVGQFCDPRLRYIYQENQGGGAARNLGIQNSVGEYVVFLGSDDFFLPNRFADQVAVLVNNPAIGAVVGGYLFVDEAGNPLREVRPWEPWPHPDVFTLLRTCCFLEQAALVRRGWVEKIGGYDASLGRHVDWDFWLRLVHAGCPISWIPGYGTCYRMHASNLSRDDGRVSKQAIVRILDKFFAAPDLPPEVRAAKDHAYAWGHLRGASREYATGYVEEAKDDVRCAIELHPEWGTTESAQMLESLLAYGYDPLVGDPQTYERVVVQNLPETLGAGLGLRRRATALARMREFFSAHKARDWPTARRSFWRAVRRDPSWLLNRGVLSIFLESMVGTRVMTILRRRGG